MKQEDEPSLRFGAWQAVHVCLQIKPEEKVVLIGDRLSEVIVEAIERECLSAGCQNVRSHCMENYGERSPDGSTPLVLPEAIATDLRDANVSFYLGASKPGELASFRTPMLDCVEENKKLRHAHMPGITREIMETGMSVDHKLLHDLSNAVLGAVRNAEEIRVSTRAGTRLHARFGYRWVLSDGFPTPQIWNNLPGSEVFTCPSWVEGTAVVDGVLGDYFAARYGLLHETPLVLEIGNGRVQDVSCANTELKADFLQYITQDKQASCIGEFAIGTNIGLKKLIGVLLQDEKFPGVHIAVGDGYAEKTGSSIRSTAHADGVMLEPTIEVDGTTLMKNGTFLLGEHA